MPNFSDSSFLVAIASFLSQYSICNLGCLADSVSNRPVKIIRIIAATGRSQVTWIHIENILNQRRTASFLSFDDVIQNFWEWLLMLEMFALAAWEINRIRECVWNLVCIGDRILSLDNNNFGVVIDKDITLEKTKILTIDWGQNISLEDPAYITVT